MPGCKLNRQAVRCLIEQGTSCEISMLLYLSRICNSFGSLRDIDYNVVTRDLYISSQTFYCTLNSLEEKGLIILDKYSSTINCTIVNNLYNNEDYSEGYVNTNHDFLYTQEFIKSKLNVKRIVLMYLLGYKNVKNAYVIKVSTLISNLGGLSKKKLIWQYIDILKLWFLIRESKKDPLGDSILSFNLILPGSRKKIKDLYYHNFIDTFCRKYNIMATRENKDDVITLLKIYGHSEKTLHEYNLLLDIICKTSLAHGALIPPLINKTLKIQLTKH